MFTLRESPLVSLEQLRVWPTILLCTWVLILVRNREYRPLIFGLAIEPIIYFIDAGIWWNSAAGSSYAAGTFIREYWIGAMQVPHGIVNLTQEKQN